MWDKHFEEILRTQLPYLSADEPLAEDSVLRDLGLDSMATVELLAALEGAYRVRFVDDALNNENFTTPAALWQTLAGMTAAAG
jgi:acyl carrier protein